GPSGGRQRRGLHRESMKGGLTRHMTRRGGSNTDHNQSPVMLAAGTKEMPFAAPFQQHHGGAFTLRTDGKRPDTEIDHPGSLLDLGTEDCSIQDSADVRL